MLPIPLPKEAFVILLYKIEAALIKAALAILYFVLPIYLPCTDWRVPHTGREEVSFFFSFFLRSYKRENLLPMRSLHGFTVKCF